MKKETGRLRRFSIKTRVTIWYVFFLILLVSLLVASLLYTSSRLIQSNIKGDLAAVVEDSVRDVTIREGKLDVDDDMVSYRDGIYVLVYQENNFIVTGSLPEGISGEIPFIPEKAREIEDDGRKFYVYDHLLDEESFDDVWIRGITSADPGKVDPGLTFITKLFLFCLPLLILLAAIGGYSITKRAFLPVSRITETAGQIEAGTDLSRRIGLNRGPGNGPSERADSEDSQTEGSKDEIYRLSATFDKMLDRLERSFEAEKQFSNDASHELRTPLSVIMAQCEYALNSAGTLEEARSALEVILGQSKKMSALISQLLALARADQGTLALRPEFLNISELVHMAALEQQEAASRKQIEIQHDIEPDIMACTDETLFLRLWINLISNSIQYGREGGFIRIALKQEQEEIIGQVEDNGIGISAEDLPKIWDRFFQANPSRSQENSAGLGLSMVKWIISALGGTIKADSTLGEGTVFTFKLPLCMEPDGETINSDKKTINSN